MEQLLRYDRLAAVAYAHRWAYGRNPRYYDYERIGGDCTSFASQCLYAGAGVMDFTPDLGWYYLDGNRNCCCRGTLYSSGSTHRSSATPLWW